MNALPPRKRPSTNRKWPLHEGCERNGPLVAREVLVATDPAVDALRCSWPSLGSSPGPAWALAEYCS